MKFVVILVIHLLIGVECGRLSREENVRRIDECGERFLPHLSGTASYYEGRPIAIDKYNWIVSVRATHSDGKDDEASGVFISPRHILTSTQALYDGNMNLNMGKIKANRTALCRYDRKGILELKTKERGKDLVEISSGFCTEKADCATPGVQNYTAVKIWLLDFCSSRTADGFPQMRSLMIVEVKPIATQTYACLIDKKDPDFKAKDWGHAYGIEKAENQPSQMLFRRPEHFSYRNQWILVPKYWSTGDRGGPLINSINNRSIITGIGASTGFYDKAAQTYFYNMKQYLDVVCTATGICPRPDPIIRTTKSPPETTTVVPTTPPTTKKVPSTTSRTSEASEAPEATESFNSTSEATSDPLEPSESVFGNETSIDNSTVPMPSKPSKPLKTSKPPVTQKPKSKPGKPEKLEKPEESEEEEEYGYEEDFIVTEDFFDNATDKLMINCLSVLLSVALILINV